MNVNKSTLTSIGLALGIIFTLFVLFVLSNTTKNNSQTIVSESTTDEQGSQIVEVNAKNGFTPNYIIAKANQNTILRMKTANTFDCSTSVRIPALNIEKTLPVTGQTDINLGMQPAGKELDVTCFMGMYSFKIKFS